MSAFSIKDKMKTDNRESNFVNLIWIDVMKGILIFLMVLGHAYVFYANFFSLFHMAAFFMISGYCWRDSHSKDIKSVKKYVLKKISRLYVPFVFINVLFILLNNIFINLGFYSNSPKFLVLTIGTSYPQKLTDYYSLSDMVKFILRTLCFAGGAAKLCAATWFLCTLFMVSVFHCMLVFIIKKTKTNDILILSVLLIICLGFAWIIDKNIISIFDAIERFPAAYSAYVGGILIRRISDSEKNPFSIDEGKIIPWIIAIVVSALTLILLFLFGVKIKLASAKIYNPFLYVLASIAGWFFIKGISVLSCKYRALRTFWVFIGTRTIPILLLHLLVFKLVSFIYLKIFREDMILLASYPIVFSSPEYFRYIYTLVGIALPLIVYQIYSYVKKNYICLLVKK